MILWVATLASPQFSPVIRKLSEVHHLRIEAMFMKSGSNGRGWGAQLPYVPHSFVDGLNPVAAFLKGFRKGLNPNVQRLVVFGYTYPAGIGVLAAARLTRKTVFTMADADAIQDAHSSRLKRAAKRALLRILFARNTRVWAISDSNAEYWSRYGLRNQIRVPFESPIPMPPGATDSPDTQEKYVLYVGRVAPEKGTDDAIAVARLLQDRGFPHRLRIVGGGAAPGAGELQEGIDFVGAVPHDELWRHYINASCLIVPSRQERYGLVVREALQFGLPVVATFGVPAALALCDYGWNIVDVGDVEGMADAAERVLLQQAKWEARPALDVSSLLAQELTGG